MIEPNNFWLAYAGKLRLNRKTRSGERTLIGLWPHCSLAEACGKQRTLNKRLSQRLQEFNLKNPLPPGQKAD
jgi:hypothetical protein